MTWRKINVHDIDVRIAEFADETPTCNFWNFYVMGIFTAIAFAFHGIGIIVDQYASIPFSKRDYSGTGDAAVAFGIMWVFAVFFMHFHFTWSTSRRLSCLSDFGKVISLIGFSCSLFYGLVQIFE